MLGLSKSIRPKEIEALVNKFTNCFTLVKEKEYWRLRINKDFPPIFDSDKDVFIYGKGDGHAIIFTEFRLVLNSKNDFGYIFFKLMETKNIEVIEEHLTRMAAFLLATQHIEKTYLLEIKKEKSRIKVNDMEKDFNE